jgi:CRISPR-associated endonuclease/helicase Cas3
LEKHDQLRRTLAATLNLDENTFLAWTVFFLALHDLGKFAEGFQNQQPALFQKLQQHTSNKPYSVRHDSLGFLFWEQCLWQLLEQEDWLSLNAQNRDDKRSWKKAFVYWARAVTGHHGQPPQRHPGNYELRLDRYFFPQDQEAAIAFCRQIRNLLLSVPHSFSLPSAKEFCKRLPKVSWWLAGISVLADWIGSNADYFPFEDAAIPLDEYWHRVRSHAVKAIAATGVLPVPVAHERALGALFPAIKDFAPTPLQNLVAALPLGQGPQLFILEDVTGAGKTEAAVLLAHRLLDAGLGQGIYMGLPTMATSNAMYERMEKVYERLFAADAEPSLVLAHSARHLSARFRKAVLPDSSIREVDYDKDEQSATARCTAWLADSRKKSLLATLGVGTIDQALLSILCSTHQSLRLLGLFGKVLIVDEVHACDAYIHELLQKLLIFHSAMGGSAILLSATLPREMREELVDAFCSGTGQVAPALVSDHYPLLTHIGGPGAIEHALNTRPDVMRRVEVRWLSDLADVETVLLQAVADGRCACWIRNTVDDALASYTALSDRIPADRVELFHARFAMGDRLAIEQRIVGRFSKNSGAAQRAGRVVIATQVVEQSLDLDFDLLISDLAPVDLLIQRAGRLCRHTRDVFGNPVTGPDQRGVPCLVVYGPELVDNPPEDWFSTVLPKAAAVYPNHGQLWLTARLLRQKSAFRMPEDARELIESVYSAEGEALIPEGLLEIHGSLVSCVVPKYNINR